MVDLHRHDDYSLFDGLGKPMELAKLAKAYGYTSIATSNHGTASGMIEHYIACKANEIKPILGVEVYFSPTFDREKVTTQKRYHLCLFCKNTKGFQNLNRILSYANIKQFYYKPIVTFELLEKYSEGIICTSACIGGLPATLCMLNKKELAKKALLKFRKIFKEDFYIEIQPYELREKGLQERVNEDLMEMSDKLGIPCILTSDSHYGHKSDYDTFLTMHMMRATKGKEQEKEEWVKSTYGERYMPELDGLRKRFLKMHSDFKVDIKLRCKEYLKNLQEIEDKVDNDIFENLEMSLPTFSDGTGISSKDILKDKIKKGLKSRGKYNKEYWARCMEEFKVITHHGFEDYFLVVQDYVKWAKEKGIAVGPGRGSVCNCEIAYAIGITDIDSIFFKLDFKRFLRMDKKKLPDIDIDFETSRRSEVIDYLLKKHPGKSVQICSYGLFKVDNLLNDLFKILGVIEKSEKLAIKTYVNKHIDEEIKDFKYDEIEFNSVTKAYNARYNNILKHFSKMYKKVRYVGTHAAGVAVVGTNIFDYISVERHGNKLTSAYDLNNLEVVKVEKFDMLGLRTMSIINELSQVTGESPQESWLDEEEIYKHFREEDTDAIFQFEKNQAKAILSNINADCIEDICAANALNRPGPLSLQMPIAFAENKFNKASKRSSVYYPYTKDTYGTIVYQEQIASICINLGNMDWAQADKVIKLAKGGVQTERAIRDRKAQEAEMKALFIKGCKDNGISKEEAYSVFDKIVTYSFNKGHASGYAVIAVWLMWYKVHYPLQFWYINLKYASNESAEFLYKRKAILDGNIILTPHVNSTAEYSIKEVEGSYCIQEGMVNIKNVGEKAALAIEAEMIANGPYTDIDNLTDRLPKQVVNSRTVEALKQAGALQMNMDKYFSNVVKVCSNISSR